MVTFQTSCKLTYRIKWVQGLCHSQEDPTFRTWLHPHLWLPLSPRLPSLWSSTNTRRSRNRNDLFLPLPLAPPTGFQASTPASPLLANFPWPPNLLQMYLWEPSSSKPGATGLFRGHLANMERILIVLTRAGEVLLSSNDPTNIPQYTGQPRAHTYTHPHTPKNYLAQNVNGADTEKRSYRLLSCEFLKGRECLRLNQITSLPGTESGTQ